MRCIHLGLLQITSALNHINLLKSWKYSEFQVFCDPLILPRGKEAMASGSWKRAYASERKPFPLYYPGLFLSGTVDLSPGRVQNHLPI
jgi:hypothetical protein